MKMSKTFVGCIPLHAWTGHEARFIARLEGYDFDVVAFDCLRGVWVVYAVGWKDRAW